MGKRLLNTIVILLVTWVIVLLPADFSQAAAITVDCSTEDWAGIPVFGFDCNEDTIVDTVDLRQVYITHDAENIYFLLDVYGEINRNGNIYFIYLDTDRSSSTGFTYGWWATGADYRIYMDQWNMGLQKFMGNNQSDDTWGWDGALYAIKTIPMAYCEGTIECAVPKTDIGETEEYDEAANILFRAWPGDDAIPYYDTLPLTYYSSARNLSSHSIPNVDNYTAYYGAGRVNDLSKYDLVILQQGMHTAEEIAQIKENGTKVLFYVSLGEDALRSLQPGDGSGPVCSGVPMNGGYASYYLDGAGETCDCDGIPDRNMTWGGYYINTCSTEWQDHVIDTLIKSAIDNGADGVFMDTIGVPEESLCGGNPYWWTSPCMINLIAAVRDAYPDIYMIANRGFYIFEDIEEYVNALMFESFTSSYESFMGCNDVIYKEWGECDLAYTGNLANQVNTVRGYPDQTSINVLALDYSSTCDIALIQEDHARAKEFGFIPGLADACLSKLYMVNPANGLLAARIGPDHMALSWIAPPEYVTESCVDRYIIKRSPDGPIDTDEKWEDAELVSDSIPASDTSFIDDNASPCKNYYALQAVKTGEMPLVGRIQSSISHIGVDWLEDTLLMTDPQNDFLPPNSPPGNENVDIRACYAAHDADYLYLRLDVYGDISRIGTQYFHYLDTDESNSTGLTFGWWTTGADFRVFMDQYNLGLQKFMGQNQTDDTWGWDGVPGAYKTIPVTYRAGTMECAVPRADIGKTALGGCVNILWRTVPGDDSVPFYNAGVVSYCLEVNPPGMARFSNVTSASIRANWTANGNPKGTSYLCEVYENTTLVRSSGWHKCPHWTFGHLKPNTIYNFRVKAKNKNGVESIWTYLGCRRTHPRKHRSSIIKWRKTIKRVLRCIFKYHH